MVRAACASEPYREAEQRAVQVDLDVAPVDRLLDGDIAPPPWTDQRSLN